ncbi:MAG: ABC transporter permease, partial [Prevotellaceae bacterium]|nr:ABC transporter permease [Prevotellaceae bacterium]
MIKHYFTVAFRNLWKYKSQTLISVVGLAVGFTCFALATLWIRYETTYDGFLKNADRIYCVSMPDVFSPTGFSRSGPHPLAAYLKETFPEISNATIIPPPRNLNFEIDGVEQKMNLLTIDSSFFSFFDVKILEGNRDFLILNSKKMAITQEKARQLFGNENPLGKVIKIKGIVSDFEFHICAIVTGLSNHTNYPFDFLQANYIDKNWNASRPDHILLELVPNIDVEVFKKKLYEHTITKDNISIRKLTLTPLTTVHYKDPNVQREVKFQHIILFAVAGLLLILCTLFNYLTLFISRFRIRQKELALRIVYGATGRSLFMLLSVEFIISLVISLVLGFIIAQPILEPFYALSEIKMDLSSIYLESLVYIAAVILISLLTFWLVLAIFRRKTLNSTIHKSNKNMFRKISVIVQLIISIEFAFCSIVILKQMYYLHNTDLGFAFKNRGSVQVRNSDVLYDKIKQISEITEAVNGFLPLIPLLSLRSIPVSTDNKETVNIEEISISEEYAAYYEFKLIEGEMLNDNDEDKYVLINESAAQALGWKESVGKSFYLYTVKGVIKNIYNFSPTISAKPMLYKYPQRKHNIILFKCAEGTWTTCKNKIEQVIKAEFPEHKYPEIINTEEEYDKFLKSENTLLKLLTFVSLVCIIICIFGFVSLVSLTCEERRKEIAIRKVNGATIKDILDIFFKEYVVLLAVGAVIAFPLGYYIMRRWL